MTRTIGLVLAGGRATRMGGVDKGLVLMAGTRLALRAVARLAPQVDSVALSANRNIEEYQRLLPQGTPVIRDIRNGYAGPLSGVEALMERIPGEEREKTFILTVPCDTPVFPLDLAKKLACGICRADDMVSVASVGGLMQPTFALLRASILPRLRAYLDANGHKLRKWYEEVGARKVEFGDMGPFANCNTARELEELEKKLTQQVPSQTRESSAIVIQTSR